MLLLEARECLYQSQIWKARAAFLLAFTFFSVGIFTALVTTLLPLCQWAESIPPAHSKQFSAFNTKLKCQERLQIDGL